jgi:CRISPR/Cas system-associated exonuclease Cas4 (RecB family)
VLKGIYDENGKKYGAEDCLCKYKELSDVYCPVNGHAPFYEMKIPTVTEMTSAAYICDRRIFYDYNKAVYQYYKSIYPLLRGKTYHKALLAEVKIKELALLTKTNGTLWGGTIDAYDPCEGILYEIKTTRALPSAVKPWDFLQMELYDYLLKQYGYDVEKYRAIYFTFEEHKQIELKPQKLPVEVIQTLLENTTEHIETFHGAFKVTWACMYCNYYRWCRMGIQHIKMAYNPRNYISPPGMGEEDTKKLSVDDFLREPLSSDIINALTPEGLTVHPGGGMVPKEAPPPSAEESYEIYRRACSGGKY